MFEAADICPHCRATVEYARDACPHMKRWELRADGTVRVLEWRERAVGRPGPIEGPTRSRLET